MLPKVVKSCQKLLTVAKKNKQQLLDKSGEERNTGLPEVDTHWLIYLMDKGMFAMQTIIISTVKVL